MARDPFLLDSTQPKTIVPAKPCIAHVQLRDLMICPRERGLVNYVVERGIVEQDVHAPGAPTRLLARLGFTPNSLTSLPVGVNDTLIAAGGQDREIHLSYHIPSSSSSSSSSTNSTKTRSRTRTPSTRQSWEFEDRLTGSINNSILLTPLTAATTALNLTPTQQSAVEPRVGISNNDGSIRMYDVPIRVHSSRRKLVCVGEVRLDVPVNHSSISPDGRTLLSVGDSSKIYLHQITGGARINFSPIHTLAVPPIPSAFFPLPHPLPLPAHPHIHSHTHPRSNLNHSNRGDLNLNPYASSYSYAYNHPSTSSLAASFSTAFSGDGSKFAVASQEGVVAVWDVRYLGGAMRVWYTDRSRGSGSSSSSSSGAASSSGGGWDRGVLGGVGSGSGWLGPGNGGSPSLSASSSYDNNANNIYNANANNNDSYLSDDPWEWTRGTRAPGWCVRSVKFNSGEGARMGKEVMCFTEHTSQIHVVDARTFETHDVIRVPTLLHPSSGSGSGSGRRRSNRGVDAGGGVSMIRGAGAGGVGVDAGRRRTAAATTSTGTPTTSTTITTGTGTSTSSNLRRLFGNSLYTREDVARIAERLADARERAFARRDLAQARARAGAGARARGLDQTLDQTLDQRGHGVREMDTGVERDTEWERVGGTRTPRGAGSTSTATSTAGAARIAHARVHGYNTGVVQALGDAFRISLPVSSGAGSASASSTGAGAAAASAIVHSAPTTPTRTASSPAAAASTAPTATTTARRYSPPASIGDSTWRTLSGATVGGSVSGGGGGPPPGRWGGVGVEGNVATAPVPAPVVAPSAPAVPAVAAPASGASSVSEDEEDEEGMMGFVEAHHLRTWARLALEEINRQDGQFVDGGLGEGDDNGEEGSDEEVEESGRARAQRRRRVRQRMMRMDDDDDIVVVPDLGDREVESEVHAVLAVHGIPSRLDGRYEDDYLDDDEMDVDIQEIEDAERDDDDEDEDGDDDDDEDDDEDEEEEEECLSRPGSRGASLERRSVRQGGGIISPAESTSMRYGSRSSSGSWTNISHNSNSNSYSTPTTSTNPSTATTPAYPDDLDLAGMCFDPCGERMYVLGVVPPSIAAGVGGDLGWGLGLAREETAGAGAGAGAVVEWSVRGAEKRWWVDEGWM